MKNPCPCSIGVSLLGVLLRKKREFIAGSFYHVTSRTNDKIRVFENKLGRKLMLKTLQDAKDRFHFQLANFCVMPTHIHLLIKPMEETSLSVIMQWIKTQSAKRWNSIHGAIDHMWGHRFFSRAIKDPQEFDFVMDYIDQNAVAAGLAKSPAEWKASGAYYKAINFQTLIDSISDKKQPDSMLLPAIPYIVSNLLPPAQSALTIKYTGAYFEDIEYLFRLIQKIPGLGESLTVQKPPVYLRYYSGFEDYLISEFDGEDTMWGEVRNSLFPSESKYQKISLSRLKSNQQIKLSKISENVPMCVQ